MPVLPVNYLTTTLEIIQEREEILFHQAVAVDNDPDDRACRTKLCAEPVGDIEKLFTMWDRWGWHRVTFYGDLREPVFEFAEAIGWQLLKKHNEPLQDYWITVRILYIPSAC